MLLVEYFDQFSTLGNEPSNAQKRAAEKYKATRREQLNLDVPKGVKEKYKAYAQSRGISLTKLFTTLIEKDMQEHGFVFDDTTEK